MRPVTMKRAATTKRPVVKSAAASQRNKVPVLQYLPLQQVTAVLGEIKMIPMPGKVSRVALGDGSVVSATTVDNNLLLIAEKVGETTLMAWSGNSVLTYKVQVVSKSLAATRAKLDALIGDTKGVAVRQVGNDLVLSGLMHKEALEQFSKLVADLPNVVNNIAVDQGTAFTRSVLFKLTFVEVKRSLLEQIGVAWSKDAQGPVLGLARRGEKHGHLQPDQPAQRRHQPAGPESDLHPSQRHQRRRVLRPGHHHRLAPESGHQRRRRARARFARTDRPQRRQGQAAGGRRSADPAGWLQRSAPPPSNSSLTACCSRSNRKSMPTTPSPPSSRPNCRRSIPR
ncbi:pilus assembly protein N-terminal domain-containing protein [Massilia sp. H-1]|nr:pilus assembly protein N-terminal domain-containing protein [Massilia sp. H-1]